MKSVLALLAAILVAASCSGPAKPALYVLGTFNVHHCEPADGGGRVYGKVAELIRLMDTDVIALQELDSCNARSAEFQAELLSRECGLEWLYRRTIPFGGGSYGIGMLYKSSLGLVGTHFLPLPGEEPRGALVAEFQRFVYVCTHFCHQSKDNRTRSMEILESWLTGRYGSSGKPVFLAGDLNSTDILDGRNSWEPFSTKEPTFVEGNSSGRIDYILKMKTEASDGVSLERTMTAGLDGVPSDSLSDHIPVFSFVRIR